MTKTDLIPRIESALDQIRPYLKADGGDVEVVEITADMVLVLRLLGACSSCAMSAMTMKAGIEQAVIREVPEIKSIEALNMIPLTQ